MIIHIDLFVNSMDEMLQFYVEKLGMRIVDDQIVSGELVRFVSDKQYNSYRVVLLKASVMGTMLELIEYLGEDKKYVDRSATGTTLTVLVPSLDEEVTRLRKKGLEPLSSVFSVSFPVVGDSRLIFYEDPERNKIELLEMIEK
ncbi:VOC family protein [Anaerosporobacter faecicola]|uniref:VOC family protein n=1 Tax=Anaerosporobacter faecicola TaxID=2718714 RepID=UPI001438875A|nr:VOC family protein [Anaerosporobacter faecicola]